MQKRRPRLTKLERQALEECANEWLAGDPVERFLGMRLHGEPTTDEEKQAVKLAAALATAVDKL
jgi:hypothetical protein